MKKIKTIGIDFDDMPESTMRKYERRMERIGSILKKYKTRHGYHYRITLSHAVSFRRSIELRYFCGDDPRRMIKDVMKVWAGFKEFDLLFTKKWRGWK